MAKTHTLYHDWLRYLIKKRVNYLSCIEVKVGLKGIPCIAQNAALFVDLILKIFCLLGVTLIDCVTNMLFDYKIDNNQDMMTL